MGPRLSWAGIFLKLAITTISLRCLFSNSKILLKCWTEPSLKDLMWNIKYFLDIKKNGPGFVLILPTTRDDLWLCQISRNDRLYKTKTICKLCYCVPYIHAYKSDFWEWKIIWKLGFRLIGATYVKFFFQPPNHGLSKFWRHYCSVKFRVRSGYITDIF